jgi:hypothetical protein
VGITDWEEFERFANLKIDCFEEHLERPNGIPAYALLNVCFHGSTRTRSGNVSENGSDLQTKTELRESFRSTGNLRGTKDLSKQALHVVNAWCSEKSLWRQYNAAAHNLRCS